MRPIDADALIAQIEAEANELVDRTEYQFAAYVAIQEVNNAPTIEPERKTGEWLPDNNTHIAPHFVCSVCKISQAVTTIMYKPIWAFLSKMRGEDGM